MKPNFRTQYNYVQPKGETNTMPGLTMPDQTMSIPELLARYAKGMPLSVKQPIYAKDDLDMDEFRKLDPVDKHRLIRERMEELKQLRTRVEKEQKEKFEAAQREKYYKEFSNNQNHKQNEQNI